MTGFVSEIFDEPRRWGLCGDPFLWHYLKNYYASVEFPYSEEALKEDILQIFKKFTGSSLAAMKIKIQPWDKS